MNRVVLALALMVSMQYRLPAQAFEVASIKPAPPEGRHGVWTYGSVSRIQMLGMNLKSLITFAYDVQGYQVSGITDPQIYDVIAKVPPETEKLQGDAWWAAIRARSRAMLADRFRLMLHRESKEISIYRLVVAKSGTRLIETGPNPGDNVVVSRRPGHLSAQQMPMSQLVDILRGQVGRPVLDQTGIKGVFDIALDWTPDDRPTANHDDAPDSQPSLFTAVQEQLGLRLEAGKSPVEVLVIDHAERASEN
jgi:uncharacterized protein (TIGR03435 family)